MSYRRKQLWSICKSLEEVKTFPAKRADFGYSPQLPLVRGKRKCCPRTEESSAREDALWCSRAVPRGAFLRGSHATTHSRLLGASGQAGAAQGQSLSQVHRAAVSANRKKSRGYLIDMPTRIRVTASMLLKGVVVRSFSFSHREHISLLLQLQGEKRICEERWKFCAGCHSAHTEPKVAVT